LRWNRYFCANKLYLCTDIDESTLAEYLQILVDISELL